MVSRELFGLAGNLADALTDRVSAATGRELPRVSGVLDGVGNALAKVPTDPRDLLSMAGSVAGGALTVGRTGLVGPVRPDRLAAMALALVRYGPTFAAGYAAGAARHPDRPAVIDDRGSLTYAELSAQAQALAAGLQDAGVRRGDAVGVLLRNSRYMMLAIAALAHLGADALLLNTGFAGPQAAEVLDRHEATALLHDEEFTDLLAEAIADPQAASRPRIIGWVDTRVGPGATSMDALIEKFARSSVGRPGRESRLIILTSGTTGTPKGAARGGSSLSVATNLFDGMPLRAGRVTAIAAPIFHAWGLANAGVAMALGSTLVLRRRFDAAQTVADLASYRVDTLVVVPVMLQRLVDVDEAVRRDNDTSSLRLVASSGSALPGDLGVRFLDSYGDVLYSLYGSTEIGYVSVAGPSDLRAAPGTAGRVLRGITVALLGEDDQPVAAGEVGRIYVGSPLLFEGYTGGGDKRRIRGLASSGDVGRFDEDGRLIVTGRDDDMIVSGGENVYPAEVEDLLASQSEIEEAAVVGVDDEKFGQRLAAYVVLRSGASLDAQQIKDRVKTGLAGYKVPRDVVFLDALPRNATGKVVKRDLPAAGEAPAPSASGRGAGAAGRGGGTSRPSRGSQTS